jgi:hypothetical protein
MCVRSQLTGLSDRFDRGFDPSPRPAGWPRRRGPTDPACWWWPGSRRP